MQDKKVAIASDHAGFALKKELSSHLKKQGYHICDFGVNDSEHSVDYPDKAKQMISAIKQDSNIWGILVCGSGEGMCMAANRYPFIRAGLGYSEESARLMRLHNNANVLCLGGRLTSFPLALKITDIFLNTPFEGGRHEKRIQKLGEPL